MRTLGTTGLVLGIWTSIAAAFPFVMPPGRPLVLVGPNAESLRAVTAAGGSILRADRLIVIARSDDPAFVRRLYAAGALLVLDAEGVGGCSGGTAIADTTRP